ncbi:MAG: hypothetical protein ACF8R7_12410 [Phycisphaerales bacterium JB039]
MSERHSGTIGQTPPVRLETLLEDFVWLHLGRAPLLALSPSRWGLGLLAALAISALQESWGALSDQEHVLGRIGREILGPLRSAGVDLLTLDPAGAQMGLTRVAAGVTNLLVQPPSLASVAMGLPELVIWLLVGGALCRMVALDFGRGQPPGPAEGVRFGVMRLGSALGAIGAPALIAAGLGAIVAVGGLLGAVPALDVVGAILGALGIVFAVVATLMVAGVLIGAPLALPAMACDGADAADAIQRTYAYLLARPIHLIAAALVALGLGVVLLEVVGWLINTGVIAAQGWAGAWSQRAGEVAAGEAAGATGAVASWIARMWAELAQAAVVGLGISYFFTASTVVYLLVRQSCDGQDYTDIWSPGATERVVEEALRARASASPVGEDGSSRLGARGDRADLAD